MDTAPMQNGEIGEWVALPEAALRLGVCVDTVRRRIKQKELPGRQVDRPQGFRCEAYVRDSDVPNGHIDSSPGKEDVGQFLAFIRELTEQKDELARQNMQLAGQVGFLQAKLDAAQQRILLLEAPAVQEPDPEESREVEEPKRPWWKFWQ